MEAVLFGDNTKIQNTEERWNRTQWKIEFRNEELVPCSVINNKPAATYVVPSALKQQAVLEKSLEGTTKQLKEVTNKLEAMEKSHKRLSEALVNSTQTRKEIQSKKHGLTVLFSVNEKRKVILK